MYKPNTEIDTIKMQISLEILLYIVENHSVHLSKITMQVDLFKPLAQILCSEFIHLQLSNILFNSLLQNF